jgi:hypothetical protein
MSIVFRCRCGQRVLIESTEPVVQCPGCRRSITVTGNPLFWGACALVLVASGLVVALAVAFRPPPPQPETAQVSTPELPRLAANDPPPQKPLPKPDAAPEPARPAEPQPQQQAPLPGPPRAGRLQPIEPAGRYQVGEKFEQTVVVARKSSFDLGGGIGIGGMGLLEQSQEASYSFGSTLEVKKVNDDGSAVIEQKIHSAKLIAATPDMRDTLTEALIKSVGTKFTLTVGPTGGVTKLTGLDDPVRFQPKAIGMGQQSLRMWSLLDADAWKEFAGLMLFQPDQPLKPGTKWERDVSHDWGVLGSWKGKTRYAAGQPKDGFEHIEFGHAIKHSHPQGGLDRTIPIEVASLRFSPPESRGVIRYDPSARRVTAAEEKFNVRGSIQVSAFGSDLAVELTEQQTFQMTVGEGQVREMKGQGQR